MTHKTMICYYGSTACLLVSMASLFFDMIPIAVIFGAAWVGMLIWSTDLFQRLYKMERRLNRRGIKTEDNNYRRIDFESDLEEDREEKRGTVRPGSKPSITYLNMRAAQEGENNDIRTEA